MYDNYFLETAEIWLVVQGIRQEFDSKIAVRDKYKFVIARDLKDQFGIHDQRKLREFKIGAVKLEDMNHVTVDSTVNTVFLCFENQYLEFPTTSQT
jgi:hypothetical protein